MGFKNVSPFKLKIMKKLLVIMSVMTGVLFIGKSDAQLNISINIGSQPAWGPAGYNHVDYYYLPDINAYYNVGTAQYIFFNNNQWRFANRLPGIYSNYDIYRAYKVVVNRQRPYLNNAYDIQHYSQYRGRAGQAILRDNNAYRSLQNKGHHYGQIKNGHHAPLKVVKAAPVRSVRNARTVRSVKPTTISRSAVRQRR